MPRGRFRTFAVVVAAIFAFAAAGAALACACVQGDASDHLKAVDVAFIGRVGAITPSRDIAGRKIKIARFVVQDTLVGEPRATREVAYLDLGPACGSAYAVGQTFAVLANRNVEGRLWTRVCFETPQSIDDYIKAVRPPPAPGCAVVAAPPPSDAALKAAPPLSRGGVAALPPPPYARVRDEPGVAWFHCPGRRSDVSDNYLAIKAVTASRGVCRRRDLAENFVVTWEDWTYVALADGPCPALRLEGEGLPLAPYVYVNGEVSDREFRRLHRWVARQGGGDLRMIHAYSAFFGLWRNYALWVERDGEDVHLHRRGYFSGLII